MRLIDGDKALKKVTEYCYESCDLGDVVDTPCESCLVMNAVTNIKETPTVDAVEVVRCKDCRWKLWTHCTRFVELPVTEEDYCSRAERRADE